MEFFGFVHLVGYLLVHILEECVLVLLYCLQQLIVEDLVVGVPPLSRIVFDEVLHVAFTVLGLLAPFSRCNLLLRLFVDQVDELSHNQIR